MGEDGVHKGTGNSHVGADTTKAQESTKKSLDLLQQMLKFRFFHSFFERAKKIVTAAGVPDTPDSDQSVIERAQIQFPTFDGTNFRVWRTKAEQFFELEAILTEQRGELLLLSKDGKAFSWQRLQE